MAQNFSITLSMNSLNPNNNILFITAWFGTCVSCLIFSCLFTFYLSNTRVVKQVNQNFKLYAAMPDNSMQVSDNIDFIDGRAVIIKNFFNNYNSPLASLSNLFVTIADKYKLDYRLLPSITMQESNGGKKIIADSFNPFGYGIYGTQVKKFTSWEEAIERVGRGIREDYLNKGLTTPEQIMPKYTPPSLASGGSWAKGVSSFMEELR